ncbi:MAG: invasion associated locus B family protein [Xenophilus sp.]
MAAGVVLAASLLAVSAARAADGAPLSSSTPGAASALQETYGDWQVSCTLHDKARRCVLVQQQRERQSRRLVLSAEWVPGEGDTASGTLVLPFGLRLADGVGLQFDDKPAARMTAAFSTCLPVGCLAPLNLSASQVRSLRGGTALKLLATAHPSGQAVTLSVPLAGFAQALDRAKVLTSH